ncbi:hypothetical protein HZU77_007050 [Neisseriaceae bacterium TC5R-5]|nr:hypothetical protein [Neisseriaceae bacterium TC5R-5]
MRPPKINAALAHLFFYHHPLPPDPRLEKVKQHLAPLPASFTMADVTEHFAISRRTASELVHSALDYKLLTISRQAHGQCFYTKVTPS